MPEPTKPGQVNPDPDGDRPMGMGKVALNGGSWLMLTQVLRVGLTMLSTVLIARLLTPDDFGVMAMAAPILTLMTILQEAGLSAATIQARTIRPEQSNALFWTNVLIGAVGAVLLVLISPLVTQFYGDERAGQIAAFSGFGLLATAAGLQHAALLSRSMQFGKIARAEIAGMMTNYGLAFVLALTLRSYWALFLGAVSGQVVQTLMLWLSMKFRPRMPSIAAARPFMNFGANLTGSTLMGFLVRNADTVFVARFHGSAVAGLYDRSYKLMLMPVQNINAPVNKLLQPALARLRDDPEQYRRIFNLGQRAVMFVSAPGVAVAAIMSDRLMVWLLGPQWEAAGPIFFWLGLCGLMQPIANLTGLLFITTDRAKQMFHWGIFSAILTLGGFAIAAPYGAEAVAASLFITSLLRCPILYIWASASTPVTATDVFAAQIEPVIGAVAVALAARHFGQGVQFLPLFLGTACLAYLAAFVTSHLTRDGRQWTWELARFAIDNGKRFLIRSRNFQQTTGEI